MLHAWCDNLDAYDQRRVRDAAAAGLGRLSLPPRPRPLIHGDFEVEYGPKSTSKSPWINRALRRQAGDDHGDRQALGSTRPARRAQSAAMDRAAPLG